MDTQHLLGILAYKRDVLSQLLTVASIFGGFSITGVVALRGDTSRDRVHALSFVAMALSAIAFIFATAFDAIWLPISHNVSSPGAIQAVIAAGDSVAWAVIAGTIGLAAAVGLLGFARSARMGVVVLALTLIAALAFALNMWTLAAAL